MCNIDTLIWAQRDTTEGLTSTGRGLRRVVPAASSSRQSYCGEKQEGNLKWLSKI